ncbi:uncharacterized protein DS421_11g328630 [Arachis hypogaea]|nr:uncharacterized protein DS421_11g328630 [Arachis hypogaea]
MNNVTDKKVGPVKKKDLKNVKIFINEKFVMVTIDINATNNFITPDEIKKLELKITEKSG